MNRVKQLLRLATLRGGALFAKLALWQVVSLAVVLGTAVAMVTPSPAHAAPHCTRYGPGNYWVDFNCWVNQDFGIPQQHQTTSVAVRDNNYISINSQSGYPWELCYIVSGSCYFYTFGTTTFGEEGSSGGYYAYAWCSWRGSPPPGAWPYGYCTTVWND